MLIVKTPEPNNKIRLLILAGEINVLFGMV